MCIGWQSLLPKLGPSKAVPGATTFGPPLLPRNCPPLLLRFCRCPAWVPFLAACPGSLPPQVLNVGLLVSALFHILELGSLLVESGVAVSLVAGRGRQGLMPCRASPSWEGQGAHPVVGFLAGLVPYALQVCIPVRPDVLAACEQTCRLPPAPHSQSRWMLPFLFTHWLLVLIASIVGLRCGRWPALVEGQQWHLAPLSGGLAPAAAHRPRAWQLCGCRRPRPQNTGGSPMRAALLCCSASGHHPAYEYAGEYEPLAAERPVSAV